MSYRVARSFTYRQKLAKMPQNKTLEAFDASDLSIAPALVKTRDVKFIPEHSNVLIIGGSGSGKTHLALGLAHAALQKKWGMHACGICRGKERK